MRTWIALFRGINVGGKNVLPMVKLRAELEALGLEQVRTYIQSGNAVFESAAEGSTSLAAQISDRVEEQYGFRPRVLVLSRDDLAAAIESNPFPGAVADPKTLHFFFLAEPALDPDHTRLEEAKAPTEHYGLTDRVFYLHAPDGIGRSKLAANAEKALGVATTARNFRTVDKLSGMVSPE